MTRPRVVLSTMGSLGDVYPFIAIALALRDAGVEPVLAAAEAYRGLADAEGIAFHPVRPGPADFLAAGYDEARATKAIIDDVAATFDLVLPHLNDGYADLAAIVGGADMVVCSVFAIPARIAAEAAGVPFVSVVFQPLAFCSYRDPPVVGEAPISPALQRRVPPAITKLLYAAVRLRFRRRGKVVDALRARLGLPRSRDEFFHGPLRARHVFALYPPAFAPLASDAPRHAQSTGFSFYNGPGAETEALHPALEAFLADGPPPLLFTLGSLAIHAPGAFYETSAAAATRLGLRAILLVGDHAVAANAHLASPDMLVAGYASHARLFPRASAVIHHGGIGTTAQALRAGVPQLVCPVLGDQFDNAERLREHGLAAVLRLTRYTPNTATAALQALLANVGIVDRARQFAPPVAAVDGPDMIARWVMGRVGVRAD